MAMNFQFAFLGCQHSYLASVTQVAKGSGHPISASVTESYGLPESFCEEYRRSASQRYIFNIRGHDYLSHMGQWTSKNRDGPVAASAVSIGEISALQVLSLENKGNRHRETDLILSFGPASGSFFADAFRLKRYRWANLPVGLEDAVQRNVCLNGYGKIHDIAVNSMGGWVMQTNEGTQFQWGGQLPMELTQALASGKAKGVSINRLYLNHQNRDEYVLLFKDGQTFISLHNHFQDKIFKLIKEWAVSKRIRDFDNKWHFISSCYCSEEDQKKPNAAYYNRRGLFHLSRGNPAQAVVYFREAHNQDCGNLDIRDNYAMALIAVRRKIQDPVLDGYLARRNDPRRNPEILQVRNDKHTEFRNEYVWMLSTMNGDLGALEAELESLQRRANANEDQGGTPEWSYRMELAKSGPPPQEIETPGEVQLHSMSAELP